MKFLRVLTLSPLCFLLLSFGHIPAAHAQQSQAPAYIPGPSGISNPSRNAPPDPGPFARHMAEKMARERNQERQKQLMAESSQLLGLAQDLNAEISKSTQDELSVSVIKEADKIEKLAKSIKNKMSYGY